MPASEAPAAPFAAPTAKPPPPPAGVALLDPPLYVQRCDAAAPCLRARLTSGPAPRPGRLSRCVDLNAVFAAPGGPVFIAAEAGTVFRSGDGGASWAEVARFARATDPLEGLEGFHWTRTAYTEDSKQAWIVDPKTGQETTIPRDRKPFTIRCVIEP